MSDLPPPLRALAEDLRLELPPRPDLTRIDTPRYTLLLRRPPSSLPTYVQRARLGAGEVAGAVDEIRAAVAARGLRRVVWELGPSSTPPDLEARLLELGVVPLPAGSTLATMVLTRPPPPPPGGILVRPVDTLDDYRIAERLRYRGFDLPEPLPDAVEALWAEHRADRHARLYLAWHEGAPIGMAQAILLDGAVVLLGGTTTPEARGRGAYRALVSARWDDAARRGTPALAVQAMPSSRPILERLGFATLGESRALLDELDETCSWPTRP